MYRFITYSFVYLLANAAGYAMKVDYACFMGKDGEHMLTEIYYSFEDKGFEYVRYNDSLGTANYRVRLDLQFPNGLSDTLYYSKSLNTAYEKDGTRYRNIQLGIQKLMLKPGFHKLNIAIEQLINDEYIIRDESPINLEIPDLHSKLELSGSAMSDYQVCYAIIPQSESPNWSSEFAKYGFNFIPLPTKDYFGNEIEVQFFYEVYFDEKTLPDSLVFKETLYDYSKIKIYDQTVTSVANTFNARLAQIPMRGRPTGVYYIESEVTNTEGQVLISNLKSKIYLTNPDIAPKQNTPFYESLSFEKSIFSTFSEDRADMEFEKLTYVLNENERAQYKNLTSLEAKQRALFAMYSVRDPDTTTTFNEFFDEYNRREEYANTHFAYGNVREGWKTDRGRIVMKYGLPDPRLEYFRRGQKNPAEIWFYPDVQGGAEFFFVDQIGIGNFILVHSTAMNELRNPNWIQMFDPALDDTELRRYQNSTRGMMNDNR